MSRDMQRPAGHLMDAPKDPGSSSTGGLCYCPSSPLGAGHAPPCDGDPLFAGSSRAGAPIGAAMSISAWLCCSDCLEGQLFKPAPCDRNRRDFYWLPGWAEQGGWEQAGILPLSGSGEAFQVDHKVAGCS